MEPLSIVLSIIGVLGTVSSILFAALAFRRNDRGTRSKVGKMKES